MNLELNGKTALVTASTDGIGFEIARARVGHGKSALSRHARHWTFSEADKIAFNGERSDLSSVSQWREKMSGTDYGGRPLIS